MCLCCVYVEVYLYNIYGYNIGMTWQHCIHSIYNNRLEGGSRKSGERKRKTREAMGKRRNGNSERATERNRDGRESKRREREQHGQYRLSTRTTDSSSINNIRRMRIHKYSQKSEPKELTQNWGRALLKRREDLKNTLELNPTPRPSNQTFLTDTRHRRMETARKELYPFGMTGVTNVRKRMSPSALIWKTICRAWESRR